MELEKPINKQRNYLASCCVVCSVIFHSKKSLKTCQKCDNPACEIHLKCINDYSICENCIKQDFKSEMKSYSSQISSLSKELQEYSSREQQLLQKISKKQKKIEELEEFLKSNQSSDLLSTSFLLSKISEQESLNLSDESMKTHLSSLLSVTENNIQGLISSVSQTQTSILKVSTVLNRSEQELQVLNSHLSSLISNCNSSISYRRLRNLTCNKCHSLIKLKLKEALVKVLDPRTSDSLLTSLFETTRKKIETRDETPCNCDLF